MIQRKESQLSALSPSTHKGRKMCVHHKISNSHAFISQSIPSFQPSTILRLAEHLPSAFCFVFSPSYSKQFPMPSVCLWVCLTDTICGQMIGEGAKESGTQLGGELRALCLRRDLLLSRAHSSSRASVNLGRQPSQLTLLIPFLAQTLLRSPRQDLGAVRGQFKGFQRSLWVRI